jgi:hypothetical protein
MDFDFLTETITPTQTTSLIVGAVGALGLPSGTVAQRPGSPTPGFFRWNTDNTVIEYWSGSTWVALGSGSGSVTSVAVSGSTGLGVSGSPITTSGTITLTLGTELQGLSGLAANGVISRTGSGTYSARTITGTASNIVVTNGDGVSGNPTINLATAGSAVTGQFVKITTDTFGRVTATASVGSSDITTALGYTPVNKAGDSMTSTANLTFSGGGEVLGLPSTPSGATAAASKAYVDSIAQGLDPKGSVRVATTAAGTLASSFANGSTVDGVTLATNDRILIKNQASALENGIYTVNSSGAPTRAVDFDAWSEIPGGFVFAEEGTANADTGWVCTSNQGGTLNITSITFVQFSGAGTYTAGTGLTLTGTQFSITSPIATSIGGTGLSSIGTANQVLGANNGATGLEYKTITAGTAVSVAHAANSITINNTGVTSAVAGTAISVSGATGAVTITNTGVTALAGTANQITASASTGSITLSTPSTFVAPGEVRVTTSLSKSISATVTAAGTNQGTGTALTSDYNAVTTTASGTGVVLPTAATPFGREVTIVNRGANPLVVYPASGAAIDGAATNAGIAVPVNGEVSFFSASTTQWYSTNQVVTAGTGVSVTQGNGAITIANTGATSIVAGTGISVSGATGAVTVSNTGVTSVALSDASTAPIYTVTGSPVTTTGTLTFTLQTQTTNKVFAAPNGSTGQPSFRALVQADLSFLQLYKENASSPTAPTAGGTNAVAIGSGASATAAAATAIGDGTDSRIAGGQVFAQGKFATAGDAQNGLYVLRNNTSNATATELFLNGSSTRLALPNNSVFVFDIVVGGRRTDATGGSAGYRFQGVIKRDANASTTALIGSVSKTVIAETNTAWDATVTADTSNGAMIITVTGEASKTIRWVATATTTEITN